MKVKTCCSICSFVTGIVFVILGIVALIVIPIIVSNTVRKSVPLYDGSFADQQWASPPYAIYFDVWLFNVTNPDEILHKGFKPSLQQKGPYSFIEKQMKINIDRPDSSNISYQNLHQYYFNQATSCETCFEGDMFIVPNVPYLTAVNLLNNFPNLTDFTRSMLNLALMAIGEHPFVFKNAKSLMFDGYKDQIFSLLQLVKNIIPGMPDKMGFFYPQNNSCDGTYFMDSGIDNLDNVGRIWTWNGKPNVSYWNLPEANMINGSDGTLYPPFIKKSSILRMFVSDICRSIYATYYGEIKVDGIDGYRFSIPEEAFNATVPSNWGFCLPTDEIYYPEYQIKLPNSSRYCLPSGFLNLSQCQFGAPVMLTSPNFLYCPQAVIDTVDGITQPGFNDITFLDLEPTSGVIMHVQRKIQLNVAMYRHDNYLMLKYVKPVIIPVLFLNESALINQQMHDYLYKNVVFLQNAAYGAAYTFLALGLLLVVAIGVAFLVLRYRRPLCNWSSKKDYDNNFDSSSTSVSSSAVRRLVQRFQTDSAINPTATQHIIDASSTQNNNDNEPILNAHQPVEYTIPRAALRT